eukprot:jgi/Bigna1/71554/fgenesh1_pg.16_\
MAMILDVRLAKFFSTGRNRGAPAPKPKHSSLIYKPEISGTAASTILTSWNIIKGKEASENGEPPYQEVGLWVMGKDARAAVVATPKGDITTTSVLRELLNLGLSLNPHPLIQNKIALLEAAHDSTQTTLVPHSERIDSLIFRELCCGLRKVSWKRVFGGQTIAQALMAAFRTLESTKPAHSLHAYFLRAGDASKPIVFSVEKAREGRSYSVRRVTATQEGKTILVLSASFHIPEDEYAAVHQSRMPRVLSPQKSMEAGANIQSEHNGRQLGKGKVRVPPPVEMWLAPAAAAAVTFRRSDRGAWGGKGPVDRGRRQSYWMRNTESGPADDITFQQCAIAYMSDWGLGGTSLKQHRIGTERKIHQVDAPRPPFFVAV